MVFYLAQTKPTPESETASLNHSLCCQISDTLSGFETLQRRPNRHDLILSSILFVYSLRQQTA
jgi:hypothetical protein